MKLSQFKYDLPAELIADHPSENRDESKLMVLNRKEKTIEHRMFKDILGYFNDGDVFDEVGAHAKGFNREGFGICLVGGKPHFNFTDKQLDALWVLMDDIEKRFPEIEWLGHCDLPEVTKECPMFDVRAWRGVT